VKFIKTLLAGAVLATVSWSASAADISGAGATFPYPVYAKWADAYKKETGVGLNYQSIGSGGGIKQIKAKTVTFGASDMPLKPEDLKVSGLVQFPMIIGGVVPVVHVKGVEPGQMVLDGATVASMYMGEITKWNDARIKKLNPKLALPDTAIAPVYRSDGSGTNFLWSNYLSKVSPEFKSTVGEGTSVKWPTGVGGKGNEGVASYVQKINGSLGYVEYAYAKQNKLSYGQMQNKAGKFVFPVDGAFRAAAAGADWKAVPGMGVVLTDQPGEAAWPITGASFILLHAKQDKPETGKEVLKFFEWSFRNGQKMAEELDYVPMPEPVVKQIEATWKGVTDASGKAVY